MRTEDMNTKDQDMVEQSGASLSGLTKMAEQAGSLAKSTSHPPLELWNPPYCGEIGLRIALDGTWYYQGSPIGRKPLVKLFASVLRKDEDGRHYLVTPVEKIGIDVEDAPFLAVEMTVEGDGVDQSLSFRTNVDDYVLIGLDNPMRFWQSSPDQGMKPYILVRGRLEALVTRALYYDLVALAEMHCVDGREMFGVWSGGVFFAITEAGQSGAEWADVKDDSDI